MVFYVLFSKGLSTSAQIQEIVIFVLTASPGPITWMRFYHQECGLRKKVVKCNYFQLEPSNITSFLIFLVVEFAVLALNNGTFQDFPIELSGTWKLHCSQAENWWKRFCCCIKYQLVCISCEFNTFLGSDKPRLALMGTNDEEIHISGIKRTILVTWNQNWCAKAANKEKLDNFECCSRFDGKSVVESIKCSMVFFSATQENGIK